MQKLLVACLASMALVGCGKKADTGAAAGSGSAAAVAATATDCTKVVSDAVDRIIPEVQKDANIPADKVATLSAAMKGVLTSHCTADKWPADYVACVSAGKSTQDMDTCDQKLGADKKKAMDEDLGKAMEAVMGEGAMAGGSGAIATPAGGSGSGSAAPAAGSGSAAPAAGSGSATP